MPLQRFFFEQAKKVCFSKMHFHIANIYDTKTNKKDYKSKQ